MKIFARSIESDQEVLLHTIYTENIVARTAAICNGTIDNGFEVAMDQLNLDELDESNEYEISVVAVNINNL